MLYQPGRYVMFRFKDGWKKVFFTGQFDKHHAPRETHDESKAKVFLSAAHGYKFGGEYRELQQWQVGRVMQ